MATEIERQLEAARARMPHLAELVESQRPILDALAENERPTATERGWPWYDRLADWLLNSVCRVGTPQRPGR